MLDDIEVTTLGENTNVVRRSSSMKYSRNQHTNSESTLREQFSNASPQLTSWQFSAWDGALWVVTLDHRAPWSVFSTPAWHWWVLHRGGPLNEWQLIILTQTVCINLWLLKLCCWSHRQAQSSLPHCRSCPTSLPLFRRSGRFLIGWMWQWMRH